MPKIFLDSGDPNETREIKKLFGDALEGQTTNPSLVAKHILATRDKQSHTPLTHEELMGYYRTAVTDISNQLTTNHDDRQNLLSIRLIPRESVSIEVYADVHTSKDEMLRQAREMYAWIPNAHIKFPITREGLAAAHEAIAEGMRINMTLCFTQEQAAAVYAATRGATRGAVLLSPFIGRLDDDGKQGMDLIANIIRMFSSGDGHVLVLGASIRSIEHIRSAGVLGCDIITTPMRILQEWHAHQQNEKSPPMSDTTREPIPYHQLDLSQDWQKFNINHPLTDRGLQRFADDWKALLI